MQDWDYGANALYFVTICTQHRAHFFGEIDDGKMMFTEIGKLVEKYWLEIRQHFPFVILHNHIVMPNHVHGIIEIAQTTIERPFVETQDFTFLRKPNEFMRANRFGAQSKNLASIVRGFKVGVTKNARIINPNFQWQSRFHDHIIRNDESYQKISNYIINNPANWREDKFFNAE